MDESKEIIKAKLEQLPDQLRSYVLGESWRQNAQKIGGQYNFGKEKYALLENEIFFVLICLEPPKDFVENIKREAGLDENTARRIADIVNGSIFAPAMKDIKSVWQKIEESAPKESGATSEPAIKSYDSFEQTILRQAQAMRPAFTSPKPSGEGGQGSGEAKPASSPTSTNPSNVGPDPYREPVE